MGALHRGEGDPIQSVLGNIVIGLVTSLLGGGFVWLWERAKKARAVNRRAAFFGVRPGETMSEVLVGPGEEDYNNNRILVTSPIGQGLIGKKVGETTEVPIPKGTLKLKVLDIRFD